MEFWEAWRGHSRESQIVCVPRNLIGNQNDGKGKGTKKEKEKANPNPTWLERGQHKQRYFTFLRSHHVSALRRFPACTAYLTGDSLSQNCLLFCIKKGQMSVQKSKFAR